MHKLIIASSTTLQISATLHKLGYMLHVQIFDVGETVDSSLWSKSYTCTVLE